MRHASQTALIVALVLGAPAMLTRQAPAQLAAGSVTLIRRPYLQQVSDRSAVIVWATAENGTATATVNGATVTARTRRYAASTTGMPTDYYQHEAAIHGLSPSTAYTYHLRVGGATAASNLSFRTAPQTGTGAARFIAFGDSGVGLTSQKTLAARMTADTSWDFALHTGDVAYGASSSGGDATYQTYHRWFFDIYRDWLSRRAFFPSLGNHDARASNGHGKAYLNLFVLPRNGATGSYPDHAERFYSFDYGPVHFVALDTELAFQDTLRRQAQLAWLADDLSSTAQPWKVVYFHRTPYSGGSVYGSNITVRQAFGPLLERHGVQLALASHEHVYERTVPVRLSTNRAHQAVTYIVTGGGGGKLYRSGGNWWTAYATAAHHYVRARISGCVLTTVAVTGGGTFDAFTLDRCSQRSDAGPPTVRITAPASGARVSGIVTVAVAAADDVRVEKVDLFVNGVWRAKDRTAPYSFAWDSRTVPAGTHTLETRAYDIAGNRVAARINVSSTGS